MVSDDRSEASEAEMIEVYLEDSEDEEEDIYIVVNDEVVTAQAEKGKLAEEWVWEFRGAKGVRETPIQLREKQRLDDKFSIFLKYSKVQLITHIIQSSTDGDIES